MNLTLNQTKLVGITMKLDLKAREYKELCKKLDDLKAQNIDENSEKLVELRDEFLKNHDEIVRLNKQLIELKNSEEEISTDIGKENISIDENIQNSDQNQDCIVNQNTIKDEVEDNNKFNTGEVENKALLEKKENIFSKIISFFKNMFKRNNK